jgi:hypothetical protein
MVSDPIHMMLQYRFNVPQGIVEPEALAYISLSWLIAFLGILKLCVFPQLGQYF